MEKSKSHIVVLLVVLILVAACSFAFGKHTGTKKQAWRSAVAAHHAAVDHCQALGKEINERLQMALRAKMTFAQFRREFGEPFPINRVTFPEAGEDDTHVFSHDASHRVFYLRFDKSVLTGHHSSHGADDIQPHLPSIEERLAVMR